MSLLELILLLVLLALSLTLIFIVVFLAAICKGKVYVGPTNIARNGVLRVSVPGIDCDAFTVRFETTQAVLETTATIDLSPWSEPSDGGVQISSGAPIAQTLTVTYASPQTVHVITFSNGSFGLQRGKIYKFSVRGRDRDDDGSAFFCKTRACCIKQTMERGSEVLQETAKWYQKQAG